MNAVTGLSHLTLSVSDLDRSVAFYAKLLGFALRMRGPSFAYLEAGPLWLALVVDAKVRRNPLPEYSHDALSVAASELPLLMETLLQAGVTRWQETDRSDSFYFFDPDGHKLELHSGDLRGRLAARAALNEPGVVIYE
jgi:catechol 2,3-dioxygenase-like lactoylglutathione lyase family enzyme